MAVPHRLAVADARVCAFVASDGMGGTVPFAYESGRAVVGPGYGLGGTVLSFDESGWAVVLGSG